MAKRTRSKRGLVANGFKHKPSAKRQEAKRRVETIQDVLNRVVDRTLEGMSPFYLKRHELGRVQLRLVALKALKEKLVEA